MQEINKIVEKADCVKVFDCYKGTKIGEMFGFSAYEIVNKIIIGQVKLPLTFGGHANIVFPMSKEYKFEAEEFIYDAYFDGHINTELTFKSGDLVFKGCLIHKYKDGYMGSLQCRIFDINGLFDSYSDVDIGDMMVTFDQDVEVSMNICD